jgi:hypothetical protein
VFAQLQKGFPERPDGKGGTAACDTWDNALLHTWAPIEGQPTPMRLEMKRLAPGAMNTWFLEVLDARSCIDVLILSRYEFWRHPMVGNLRNRSTSQRCQRRSLREIGRFSCPRREVIPWRGITYPLDERHPISEPEFWLCWPMTDRPVTRLS